MHIRHVHIRWFRGIVSLDWDIKAQLVCLVGPGDSTKTTILDAISYALSPRWSLPIHDGDFHNGDTNHPIEIQVTVTHLPPELLAEKKYGLFLRGWAPHDGIRDVPLASDETALTIRLRIDESLEPTWTVIKDAGQESKGIAAADRMALQLFRVDDGHIDQHLGWGRGSALAAMTGEGPKILTIVAEAHRKARAAVFDGANPQLQAAADEARTAAIELGVAPRSTFRPGLNPRAGSSAALILHDGEIPVAATGLGSRRLTALAIQRAQVQAGSIMVIDEVEHGLEPHRLVHLLTKLREAVTPPTAAAAGDGSDQHRYGQILLSTHSSVTVTELRAEDLHVVRAQAGKVKVLRVPDALNTITHGRAQGTIRAGAAALLAKRIVVGEGPTEVGLCRALAAHWATTHPAPLAHLGTAITNGAGDPQAIEYATCFAELGYPTALLLDADTTTDTTAAEAAGVQVVRWSGGVALEERIALDLPERMLGELVELAITETGSEQTSILAAIAARLPGHPQLTGTDPTAWVTPACPLEDIRRAIGRTAKAKNWFKRQDRGEALGQLVVRALADTAGSDLAAKLQQLERFAYADPDPDPPSKPSPNGNA